MPGTGDQVLARGRAEVFPQRHRYPGAQGRVAEQRKLGLAAFQFRVLKGRVPLGFKLRLASATHNAQLVAAGFF